MCVGPFKRICHLGPLTAIAIIKVVTMTTIQCSRQWLPPTESFWGAANFLVFISLSLSTIYHFLNAIYEGPGFLPLGWQPAQPEDVKYLQYCSVCEGYKAPRSHHCKKCQRCVMKMDHHCPWINNCVGHRNHAHFTVFLASAVCGCSVSTFITISWVLSVLSLSPRQPVFPAPPIWQLMMAVFAMGLSIGVVLAVGALLYFQLRGIFTNRTGIEDWILEKAQCRRSGPTDVPFVHPYSKSCWSNTKQVLTWDCTPTGDGIVWDVIPGCDQYTLTREQLAQKLEKSRRSRKYRVVAPFSGSYLPVSHGWGVFCHPPCTDEPRIRLQAGDVLVVTRWRRHWLFGERERVGPQGANDDKRKPRGWFPRVCVIEMIEKNSSKND